MNLYGDSVVLKKKKKEEENKGKNSKKEEKEIPHFLKGLQKKRKIQRK